MWCKDVWLLSGGGRVGEMMIIVLMHEAMVDITVIRLTVMNCNVLMNRGLNAVPTDNFIWV